MNITQYWNEALEELRHIRWPTRRQAIRLSLIVLGFTVAFTVFLGLADYILSIAMKAVLNSTLY